MPTGIANDASFHVELTTAPENLFTGISPRQYILTTIDSGYNVTDIASSQREDRTSDENHICVDTMDIAVDQYLGQFAFCVSQPLAIWQTRYQERNWHSYHDLIANCWYTTRV